MKIGIIIGLISENESMFINGIKLNALNLAKTLMEIEGTDVVILDTSTVVKDLTKVSWDYNKYRIEKYQDRKYDMDILIMLGSSLPTSVINDIRSKNKNTKIVKYQCGNSYVVDMERSIFDTAEDNAHPSWDHGHDETWLIPQQEYQNLEYFKVLYRHQDADIKVVPFIWDPEQLDLFNDKLKAAGKLTPEYKPKPSNEKKLSVMEPNMNVVKYSIIPLLMTEVIYRENPDSFKQLYIGSGKKLLKNHYYMKGIKHLDCISSDKVKYIARYPINVFLSSETDIVISHQWANPLNYSYLDAMYYGYPIVHNAEMIQDAGYYYNAFDVTEGANQLKKALTEHDDNLEEYNKVNKKILERYTSTNPEIVDTYKKLIDNLFKPGTHEMSYEYDWKTNLYK